MNRKERLILEKIEVKKYVYSTKGANECPYESGSRKAKFWNSYHSHYWQMERLCDEMADIYGEWRN